MSRRTLPAGPCLCGLILVLLAATAGCAEQPRGPVGIDWHAEGPIRIIDSRVWIVGNQLVTLAPDATINGTPSVDAVARVEGARSARGELIVRRVEIVQTAAATPAAPPPVPLPTQAAPDPTVAPTAAPATKPTPRPDAKPVAKPTAPAPPKSVPPRRGEDDDD